ncbi:MAG: hypothetical protein FWE71_07090 [Nocardioidaceae bacterium]|nr:hypothetical protein [Nocardioidaceae bacterium]MCL2612216.1 hypothetical protein [Nocardioidaceae bacterium]
MSKTESPATKHRSRRRHLAPLMWASGAVAAVLLVLGVNGTLSDWATAKITNDTNTVKAADSVILQESGPNSAVCNSTDSADASNEYTCSTINKYGGTATPLEPGDDQSVTVTMTNTGTASGSLTLKPSACGMTGGSPTASSSICAVATVTVSCTSPSALDTTATPATLDDFTGGGAQSVATLDAGASTDCTFDVALPSDASPQIAGQVASQPLVWTLTATP